MTWLKEAINEGVRDGFDAEEFVVTFAVAESLTTSPA
jgi:hypothetical protein